MKRKTIKGLPGAVAAGAVLSMFAAGPAHASALCGDVDDSSTLTASDALAVLRAAVGQAVELLCAPPAQVPKTGVTSCYDADGQQIDCVGTGQDGELQRGVSRSFTDNGDGTVTDGITGLMWEKLSNDESIHKVGDSYTWEEAFDVKIAALNAASFAGYDDWRLPNIFEIETLRNMGALNAATYSVFSKNCSAGCTIATCSCTRPDAYWSSTTAKATADATSAWYVFFYDGNTFAKDKMALGRVRAVRGGS